jgi:hypothetical protein
MIETKQGFGGGMEKTITYKVAKFNITEEWESADCFCPACGNEETWMECGEGDYYVGEKHVCLDCNAVFHLPYCSNATGDDLAIIQALKK